MPLSDEQLERYARHIVLREVGGVGQAKLLASRVLVVGAGGLGSPLVLYLAAAGIGTIGIVDFDAVSLSNLQRQIVHRTEDIGVLKTDLCGARGAGRSIRTCRSSSIPTVSLRTTRAIWSAATISSPMGPIIFRRASWSTTFGYFAARPLVSAAVTEFGRSARDVQGFRQNRTLSLLPVHFPETPPAGAAPSCSETGVLGAAAGVMGTLQALEVVEGGSLHRRESRRTPPDLRGASGTLPQGQGSPRSEMPLCGDNPTILPTLRSANS